MWACTGNASPARSPMQDQRGIPVAIATIAPGLSHQLFDLSGSDIPGSSELTGYAARRLGGAQFSRIARVTDRTGEKIAPTELAAAMGRGDEIRALRELRRQFPGQRLCVRHQAGRAIRTGRGEPAYQAYRPARQLSVQGARSYAPSWLRLRAGERWPRHTANSGLARSPPNPVYGAL